MARNIGATLSLRDNNFFANVRRATSELGGLERSTTSATGKLSKLGGIASTVGKGLLTATAVGITAMTGLTVKALDMAGELEQNLGGSEAVFAEFANNLQKTGEGAFTTMGLSMSDFLGTANKMGALFQGSGFTIQESAELTTNAMQRAADVASIMGIDVNAAMEAVTGAAKGNFTMMDNLGVAINDTTIKNYALANGIQTVGKTMTTQEKSAIAMQLFMEKTAYAAGNYAKENETLAGSINTAKAAFQTFMSGAGDADAIADAFVNVATVVTDKVGELLPTLTSGISEVIKKLTPKIPGLLQKTMPGIVTGAMSFVSAFADVIPSFITVIAESLPKILPVLVSGFAEVISKLATTIITNAPILLQGIGEGIRAAFTSINLSGVGDLLGGAFEGLSVVLSGVLTAATNVFNFFVNNWNSIAPIIAGIAGALVAYKAAVIAISAVEKIRAAVTGVVTAAQWLLNVAMSANPIGIIILAIGALIAIGVALWMNWDSICAWLGGVWEGVKTVAINVWNGICDFFVAWWPYIFAIFTGGISLIVGFVINNWDTIKETTLTVFNAVKDTVINIWNGIVSGIKGAINLIIGAINGLIRGFVNGINGLINGVNSVTGAIGIPAIPTFTAPQIPMLAKGGDIGTSGRVLVGEKGPEYLDLPKGARVTPLDKAPSGTDFSGMAGIKNAITSAADVIATAIGGLVRELGGIFGNISFSPIIPQMPTTPTAEVVQRKKEPPKSDNGKNESNITINIYADGKSSDEVINDLVPKLKLAIANI